MGELTKWCDKVGVRLQGFVVASILDVPHSQGFIIRRAHYELAARVEDETAHPVIVTDLEKHKIIVGMSQFTINHAHGLGSCFLQTASRQIANQQQN